MPDQLDQLSEQIASRMSEAKDFLARAEKIFEEETTDEHRQDWPNVYRLESAVNHAQEVLARADPRIVREAVATELLEAANLARQTIHEAVTTGAGSLIGAAESLLNATARVEPQIIPSEDELDTVVARLKEFQHEIEKSKSRVDQLIGEQNANFNEAEEKRDSRFDAALVRAESNLNQASVDFDKRATEATNHIGELEEDISKTAAALGGGAIALDNYKESEEQTKRAFWWTVLTVVLLLIAAAIPIAIGIEQSHQSPESVAGKITVALILAGIASYTAGVARHHRQRAATARRLAIELNAFGPFIASLEKADRDDLRSTIVWRFFGPPDALNQESDAEPTPGPRIVQLLKSRREARKKPDVDA